MKHFLSRRQVNYDTTATILCLQYPLVSLEYLFPYSHVGFFYNSPIMWILQNMFSDITEFIVTGLPTYFWEGNQPTWGIS